MNFLKTLFLLLLITTGHMGLWACSMYKITVDGRTMVGCNHDAWLTTPRIWFANGALPDDFGAVFTGARPMSNSRIAPQSGMNTAGLTYSRLASYYPEKENPFGDRLMIADEVDYLTGILHKCESISDVKEYIARYDHSYFMNAVFIYIDKAGNYLIVEPYQMIEGNDPNYLLANYCPSITTRQDARKMERYRNGEDFLSQRKVEATIDFCTALSDTMHVCRDRNGDGTLLTSVWDSQEGHVDLYFYHDYDQSIRYNLKQELDKGDHYYDIADIFPTNSEFERLVEFKTPSNTVNLRILLVLAAGLLALFALLLWIVQLFNRSSLSPRVSALFTILNAILIGYIMVLITHKEIFYFEVPYKHHSSFWISMSSYVPFVLLLGLIPIGKIIWNHWKSNEAMLLNKSVMVSNYVLYVVFIWAFAYWGLFEFWM